MNPDSESKPQGSEQPKCWACNNERLTIINENPTWYRCPHCREEFQWPIPDAPMGPLTGSPLPNPSADEEVETPRTDAGQFQAHDSRPDRMVVDAFLSRTIEHELIQLRQQHNAEREEDRITIEKAKAWINGLAEQASHLRASLAEKERENTQLKRENENTWRAHGQIVSQLSALQSELATAQKERFTPSKLNTKYLQQIESLKSQLQSAMEERDALIAAAKCQNEFEVLVEKESYKNLRPDEAKRMEELQAVMNKAADIVEPMTPPAALLSRLSTSRSTENKT